MITESFNLFKGWADFGFHFIKQGGPESVAQIGIAEMIDIAPETVVTVAAFRDETMDMRVPFQIPSEGMKDHDKTGGEIHGLILLIKHLGNNTVYSMEETIKQYPVIKEKLPECCGQVFL